MFHQHDFVPPGNDDAQQCDADCRENWHRCSVCGKSRSELRKEFEAIDPQVMRLKIRQGDINSYGDYTVKHWFSAGSDADPMTEDFEHRGAGKSLTIMGFGLAGEAGEVAEKIKKIFRGDPDAPDFNAIKKELGDVVFYWARICRYFGWQPSDVLGTNVDKLDDRRARGASKGSGDNR